MEVSKKYIQSLSSQINKSSNKKSPTVKKLFYETIMLRFINQEYNLLNKIKINNFKTVTPKVNSRVGSRPKVSDYDFVQKCTIKSE